MKYIIDFSFVTHKLLHFSITIYGLGILSSIPDDRIADFVIIIRSDVEIFFKKKFPNYTYRIIHLGLIAYIPKIQFYCSNLLFKKIIRSIKYDKIFMISDPVEHSLSDYDGKKIIVIHDLKVIKYDANNSNKIKEMYEQYINSASHIIAISNYTKRDILNYFKIDEGKISVIYNSITLSEESECPKNFNSSNKFILYVNTLMKYKNLLTLLKAYNDKELKDNFLLVIVGKKTPYWYNVAYPYIESQNLNNKIIRLDNLSDNELRYLYEKATLFVSPSLHEGFGYTPIEAAICKCPVVCSKCEALPDTTQLLLNYYDPPCDVNELRNKIKQIIEFPPTKEHLQNISNIYSRKYSKNNQIHGILNILDDNL